MSGSYPARVAQLCRDAAARAEALGYRTCLLTDRLQCEAREAGRFLSAMQEGYSRSLYVVLDHWKLTLTALLLVVAANVWMYIVVPKGFFPQQDTGVIMGGIRADQSASFQDMEVKLARLVRILSADPAVDQVSAHISGGRGGGGVFISLKPLEERGITLNTAYAVVAAYSVGDFLAFTLQFSPAHALPMMAGRLLSGLLAVVLCLKTTPKTT